MARGSGWLGEDTQVPLGVTTTGQEASALLESLLPQRFSMEGISNILQSSIRQTFGSSGTDKQVRAISLVPALLLDSCRVAPAPPAGRAESGDLVGLSQCSATVVLTCSTQREEQSKP